ncbi:MAG: dienelactone hydrolase family protein, partial [Moraxellaceae bacterium]|nr:dienelactone hydrolase family protein [Moraxellaceae bacterium]
LKRMLSTDFVLPTVAGEHRGLIHGLAGAIELRVHVPEKVRANAVAVICHPHPQFGGTLDNKVVFTVFRAYRELDLVTVRFNFRGVGASQGSYADGMGEQDDLKAVLAWLHQQGSFSELTLAGFSFGSSVATAVWSQALAQGWLGVELLLIAPPVTRFLLPDELLPSVARVAYGDADEVIDPDQIAQWLKTYGQAADIAVFPGAGHFFHGQLADLKHWVASGWRGLEA